MAIYFNQMCTDDDHIPYGSSFTWNIDYGDVNPSFYCEENIRDQFIHYLKY